MEHQTPSPAKQHMPGKLPAATLEQIPAPIIDKNYLNLAHLTPDRILQLQRTIGNRAVQRLLISAQPRLGQIQRVARNHLRPGNRVKFSDMTVIRGWWIEPGTTAVVTRMPGNSNVEVKIKSNQYEGETLTIDPKYLELDTTPFTGYYAFQWR